MPHTAERLSGPAWCIALAVIGIASIATCVALELASFGPVLALAIICLIQQRRRFREPLPIYATIGYFAIVHIVTIASIRYRLPIEPLLIVLGGWPISLLVRFGLGMPRPAPQQPARQ